MDSDVQFDGCFMSFFLFEEGVVNFFIDVGFYLVCDNVISFGQVGLDQYFCGVGNIFVLIVSVVVFEGGSGVIEYFWMSSMVVGLFNFQIWQFVLNSNMLDYVFGLFEEIIYFVCCVCWFGCIVYLESNIVIIEVGVELVVEIIGFVIFCVGEFVIFIVIDVGFGVIYEWEMGFGFIFFFVMGQEVMLFVFYFYGCFCFIFFVIVNGCMAM